MENEVVTQIDPKILKAIKIGAIVVGVIVGVTVVGLIASKMGAFDNGIEVIEDGITEVASAAS